MLYRSGVNKKGHSFTVGLVQLDVGPNTRRNVEKAVRLCERAARRGADVICLPELFHFMGDFHHPCASAETVKGESISALRSIAAKHRVFIVAGSILERHGAGLPLNTCFFIGPDGEILSRYSKMHLFDVGIPGGIRFLESHSMKPGNHATIIETKLGAFGFAICNDLRYPELFRAMAKAGAQVNFLPSAFTQISRVATTGWPLRA